EMVNAARFAKGMTFEQYRQFVAAPENLAREGSRGPRRDYGEYLRAAYDATRLSPAHEAAWKWLLCQPCRAPQGLGRSRGRTADAPPRGRRAWPTGRGWTSASSRGTERPAAAARAGSRTRPMPS